MRHLLLALISLSLFACSNSENPGSSGNGSSEPLPAYLEGMVKIASNGGEVFLGTNAEEAKPIERPQMHATFSYDFYIARTEATCGEFNELMHGETGITLDCASNDIPATDVSYYDAVLFTNAKSKAAGLDTAYTYNKIVLDAEKHCTNLEGFEFHPEVNAFRLPTEAEWILTANMYSNKVYSWNSDNSGFALHPICTKAPSKDDICDIVGNAMELVNDWMGSLRDTSVHNYLGASEGSSIGQRIVKGGSYRDAAVAINHYSRGDVYTVTSGTRTAYIGFRIAFGAIPNATTTNDEGDTQSGVISPVANFATVRSLAGSFMVKLAFRNDISGNLAFIDYASGDPYVSEIADTMDVYHPDISPDGSRVAFCTGLEGVSGKSEIYVRKLDDAGSDLVKLDFENAAIPRWRVLESGDTVIVFVSDAGNNRENATFMGKSTWQVTFANGNFGTPQKLFDGAYHGGISDDNSLAVTGSSLLRARIAKSGSDSSTDTVWYAGEQACNVSLANDGSKRTMFLDFGGKPGREFAGSSYGTHERLLIADKNGKLIQSVAAPGGYSFDHSEWAHGLKDIAVATLANKNGAHTKIALVDISNSTLVELAKGSELWHPCLWAYPLTGISTYGKLDPDSAASYYYGRDAKLFTFKMNALWSISDSVEIVALGSSRMSSGFEAKAMQSGYAFNMATVPCDMDVIGFAAENYVLPHCKKLKFLIVSVDFDLWSEKPGYNLNKNIGGIPGFAYDKNHSYWKDSLPPHFIELNTNYLKGIYFLDSFKEEYLGWVNLQPGGWTTGGYNENAVVGDSTWSDSRIYSASMDRLKSLIEYAREKDIVLVGVIFPQSPYYKKTGSFGRYGMRRSTADSLTKVLKDWTKKYSNFMFVDENKMGNHNYADDMAYDYDHLSIPGARKITMTLDSLIGLRK